MTATNATTNASANVLHLCVQDAANSCNRWTRAINSHAPEVKAEVASFDAHPYRYAERNVLDMNSDADLQRLREMLEAAELLVVGQTLVDYPVWTDSRLAAVTQRVNYETVGRHAAGKPVVIRHHGSMYRALDIACDVIDTMAGVRHRLVAPDLMHKASSGTFTQAGGKNIPYLHAVEVSDDLIAKATQTHNDLPVVLHCPSNRGTKGTPLVQHVVSLFGSRIRYVEISGAHPDEVMRAKAECDIYIDQIEPSIGGFGASAIESLALGKPTIASIGNVLLAKDEIEKHWRLPPIMHAWDIGSLHAAIKTLVDSKDKLREASTTAATWINEVGHAKHVARRLADTYLSIIEEARGEG